MFEHWIRRLSVRLWLTGVAAFAVSMGVLAAGVVFIFNQYPEQTLGRSEQREKIDQLERAMKFDANGCLVALTQQRSMWVYDVLSSDFMYRILDGDGRIRYASERARHGAPWLSGELAAAAGHQKKAMLDGTPFEVETRRVAHGACQYYVQIAISRRIVHAIVESKIGPVLEIAGIAVLIAMVVFGLTLTVTLRRQLEPLRQASREAAELSTRNLAARLSVRGGPKETEPLITAFNDALSRLEHGFVVQKQFLASTAHELQTPLTLIRGQIELQPGIAGKDQLFRDIDLMARQVGQLLHLAEVSEVQNFSYGEIDPAHVARDVVAYLSAKANGRQVTLNVDARARESRVRADAGALFILLKNLVENAIHASPEQGIVLLAVDASSIHVIDEGPGIPDKYLPFLFDRFWRAPGADYDGAGLGLAICKEIATAHGWSLIARCANPGAEFAIRFASIDGGRAKHDAG